MSYRPITDVWLLARPKVKYYGAYLSGFAERARALLGVHIEDPVLHVCSGKASEYPIRGGFGPNDATLDIDPKVYPDYCQSALEEIPDAPWKAMLVDPPYSEEDAKHYRTGDYPNPQQLLRNCLDHTIEGGRVGIVHYLWVRPPKDQVKLIACVGVIAGYGNRMRVYSVYEKRSK